MMKYCLISTLIILRCCDANVPRPVRIAAIFDDNSGIRHDLMFVNAIKERGNIVLKIDTIQVKLQR